jgi:hypothetical protein
MRLESIITKRALLNFVIVEAEFLQILESVERRCSDVVDFSLRNPQIDERRHSVEDSGRHEVDAALLDGQDLQLRQGLKAGRHSGQPAVGDIQLLKRLGDQTIKGSVAYVLVKDYENISSFNIFDPKN